MWLGNLNDCLTAIVTANKLAQYYGEHGEFERDIYIAKETDSQFQGCGVDIGLDLSHELLEGAPRDQRCCVVLIYAHEAHFPSALGKELGDNVS
jgi:hypothetical protein